MDVRYWDPITINKINQIIRTQKYIYLKNINIIKTKRGKSPSAAEYVSEAEGFALVVKAGTNISKQGYLLTFGDYIEEGYLKENYKDEMMLKDGDILLASTGDGTLGKSCVYRNKNSEGNTKPAIADGHVTVIRVDNNKKFPEYLCDYLRKGFGWEQINRLYTGSTGLIEIQPDDVDEIIIPELPSLDEQKIRSEKLRNMEHETNNIIESSKEKLEKEEKEFFNKSFNWGSLDLS